MATVDQVDQVLYHYPHKLTAARLKKVTAKSFRLANSARIFVNLSWCDIIQYSK